MAVASRPEGRFKNIDGCGEIEIPNMKGEHVVTRCGVGSRLRRHREGGLGAQLSHAMRHAFFGKYRRGGVVSARGA